MHVLDLIPSLLVNNLVGELVIQLSDSARQDLLMVLEETNLCILMWMRMRCWMPPLITREHVIFSKP